MRVLWIILICTSVLDAQEEELWVGSSFEHEVTPYWGYDIVTEYRYALGAAAQGEYLLTFGVNRYVADNLSVTVAGRYEIPRGGTQEFRLLSDLDYSRRLVGPFSFDTRLRLQTDRPIGADGGGRQVALRARGGLVTKLAEYLDVVFEYEGRYRFDTRNEWSRLRYTAGLEWRITDATALEVYYRLQDDINEGRDLRTPIYGVYLAFVLPDDRDRDWDYRRPFGRSFLW